MDYHKLYGSLKENLFTDLTIILMDGNHHLTIDLHKIILYSSCIYFEKLLTNCREKNANSITIIVPNVDVVYDIIMSFYGQKIEKLHQWEYLLDYIKCCDFLGIVLDASILANVKIPEEAFEELLDIIELVGYNKVAILRWVYKNSLRLKYCLQKFMPKDNLPKNYD